ncbi:MAG: family 43 glycosylhydrolase [Bacillota bacterium]
MRKKLKISLTLLVSVILLVVVLFSGGVDAMSSEPAEESASKDKEVVANEEGLIAHYPLNQNLQEVTGNFAQGKASGPKIDGEKSGSISYSAGMRDQAAVFDGQSGIRLADGLIKDNSYSVSLWVNPEEINQYTPTFFGAEAKDQWVSVVPNGPTGETMLWSGEEWYDASTYFKIATDQWTHLTITVDKGKAKVYLNGEERFSGPDFPDVFTTKQSEFALGINYWDTPFKGLMDDLRIYDRAISEDKVKELAEGAAEIDDSDGPQFREVSVHDPSVIKDGDTFHVVGSHLASAKSKDLIQWEQQSRSVNNDNPLIPNVKNEMREGLNWAKTETFWAGDIIKLDDGKYYMYYSMCKGDSPRSALGVAVSENVDGPYKKKDLLLKSGMWGEESEDGQIYDLDIHPNAVDPNVFFDDEDKLWMVYGSYSGGIFILEMNPKTAKPYPNQGYGKKLMGGKSRIEAPYIQYSPETGYYYLFTSFGGLGAGDGYNIRVARSKNPDGPYKDPQGQDMIDSYGTGIDNDDAIEPYGAKLVGDFQFVDQQEKPTGVGYVSPGHNSTFYNQETGEYFILFHSRFPDQGESHQLRVHKMFMNDNGWPVIAPHRYGGEQIANYSKEEIVGQYAVVNHGKNVSGLLRDSVMVELNKDGTISGKMNGQWERNGENGIKLMIEGATYDGVLLRQWDDGLEKEVMTFSVLSQEGVAIWGSKVDK